MSARPSVTPATWRLVEASVAAVCVILVLAVVSLVPHFAPGAFHDDGVYLSLGQSIASGHGYRSIYQVGAPVHAKYPPGLPVLFALFWLLGSTLRPVAHLAFGAAVLISGTAAACLWLVARRLDFTAPLALASVFLPLLLYPAITYLTLAISEPYFIFLWALALLLCARAHEALPRQATARDLMLGFVLALGLLIRTEAAAVAAGVLGALWYARMPARRIARTGAVALVPALVWHAWHARMLAAGPVSSAPDELPYLEWVSVRDAGSLALLIARSAMANARTYAALLAGLLSGSSVVGALLACIAFALVVLGCVRARAARAPRSLHPDALPCALVATLVLCSATVLVWPFAQDRLMLSLLPFAALCAAYGLHALIAAHAPLRTALLLLLSACVVAVGWRQFTLRRETLAGEVSHTKPSTFVPDYALFFNSRFVRSAALWLRANTDADARVLADFPAAIYLNSGRHTLAANPSESPYGEARVFRVAGEYLRTVALRDSIDVVIVSGPAQGMKRDVSTVLALCPDALVLRDPGDAAPLPPVYSVRRDVLIARGDACLALPPRSLAKP